MRVAELHLRPLWCGQLAGRGEQVQPPRGRHDDGDLAGSDQWERAARAWRQVRNMVEVRRVHRGDVLTDQLAHGRRPGVGRVLDHPPRMTCA